MRKSVYTFLAFVFFTLQVSGQVSTVEFGKNRVQYKKISWKYYQTRNFNTYYHEGGLSLGKYVAQVAEEELTSIEEFVEYGLQRRANIVIYNSFEEYKQSNIGIGIDWQNTGGVTKLVNNKIIIFNDGNLNSLKIKIRQGIAKILVENLLFGDDLGEFASNKALLDIPKWLIDGYIAFVGENWSTELDDQLKSVLLSAKYKTFYQFAFSEPQLAGHSFWRFIGEKYQRDNITYFLYLSRIYKSLNSASLKVTKQKFNDLLKEFMEVESDKYLDETRGRRNLPKGNIVAIEEKNIYEDFYNFQANPIPRNSTYAMVHYKKGIYKIVFEDFSEKRKILLKSGILNLQDELNPNYPILAWDPKGSHILCIYSEEGKIKMFVYDVVARIKINKQVLDEFQIIQDAKYMLDNNTLILSAVKNGQTDIFTYKINEKRIEQITNDIYDDLDPSFAAFPNKNGILFASNRPSANAIKSDTAIPSRNNFNIFMVDNWTKSEFRQITMLTNQDIGQARFPLQYNVNHFTFVSDANGIANRYAGFFSTKRAGLDTIYRIGDDVLRNPDKKELDSTLKNWEKKVPDSVGYISITSDSTYTFPITNYQSSLQETRGSGDNNQVSEVRQEGDLKLLYKLRINETVLQRRNISLKPTAYMKEILENQKKFLLNSDQFQEARRLGINEQKNPIFQTEFDNSSLDSNSKPYSSSLIQTPNNILEKAKLYDYRLKFSSDYFVTAFNNSVMNNRLQPYGYGNGPIYLNFNNSGGGLLGNINNLTGLVRMGISDLMEDQKIMGGYRLALNLKDNDYFASYQNKKRRFDWGLSYYRSNIEQFNIFKKGTFYADLNNKLQSSLYQFNISYPFDENKSIRFTLGYRRDRVVFPSVGSFDTSLVVPDTIMHYTLNRVEYVYDNTISKTLNIWNGLRYKIYSDVNSRLVNSKNSGKFMFNVGGDLRYYLPIYRNVIWAGRVAADFSFGTEKIIYYLGGTDGWINPKFNEANRPDNDIDYAFQTLSGNLRGFKQNIANGNNTIVINSEFRLPLFATIFNRPINNAFIRNFQLVQFFDLGSAWNGKFDNLKRPYTIYGNPPLQVRVKTGGVGPLIGGYGFGARSTLFGYFLRVDAGWPMGGFFNSKPLWYFSLGLDF
jgi:hypothetical protein